VNVRHFPGVEEGPENAEFTITTKEWLDRYDEEYDKASVTVNLHAQTHH